jgi:hypothetical protein
MQHCLGVEWASPSVIRVDKFAFARLLGIKTIDGSLFHQQGNFPTHGFVELNESEARQTCPINALRGVDFENVRLLRHAAGLFTQTCTAEDMLRCRWISTRRRSR